VYLPSPVRLRVKRHCKVALIAWVRQPIPTGCPQQPKPDGALGLGQDYLGLPKGAGMDESDQNPEDSALALPVKVLVTTCIGIYISQ